jgi:thymidylate kinase
MTSQHEPQRPLAVTSEQQESLGGSTMPASRRGKPVRVSFSGLDGSGKSFQIDALLSRLGEDRRVEVIWVPLKFWPENVKDLVPPRLRRMLRPRHEGVVDLPSRPRTHADAGDDKAPPRTTGELAAKAARALRTSPWFMMGTMAAASTGLSLRRRTTSSTADVVVLDRYRLDSSVKLQRLYPGVSRAWLARVVRLLTPTPDLEVLLRLDPQVAYRRKPEEWSVRQLTEHAQLYDGLASGSRSVVTLDGAQDPEVIAREVWSRVVPLLHGR